MNKPVELSIIVCTYNRQQYLKITLEHLRDQEADYDRYEIIVIDNNSPDKSESICKNFIAAHTTLNIQYFKELQQGHTYARNRGIRESSGKYLAFIDDDAYAHRTFVTNIIKFFDAQDDIMAIGGKILPKYETQEPSWMSKYLFPLVSALDMGDEVRPFRGSKYPIGANMAFRRSVFDQFGLFDTAFGRKGEGLEGGDEKELLFRLKRHHQKISYVPTVVVDHIIPDRRLQIDYIKGLAIGVGTTERKRVRRLGLKGKMLKLFEEGYKMIGSIVLSLAYSLTLQFSKALMLIKLRIWIWLGLLKG